MSRNNNTNNIINIFLKNRSKKRAISAKSLNRSLGKLATSQLNYFDQDRINIKDINFNKGIDKKILDRNYKLVLQAIKPNLTKLDLIKENLFHNKPFSLLSSLINRDFLSKVIIDCLLFFSIFEIMTIITHLMINKPIDSMSTIATYLLSLLLSLIKNILFFIVRPKV